MLVLVWTHEDSSPTSVVKRLAIPGLIMMGWLLTTACQADPSVRKQRYFESGNQAFAEGKYQHAIIEIPAVELPSLSWSPHVSRLERHRLSESELKLRRAFAAGLNLDEADVTDDLTYAKSTGWDSIAHMALVAALDEAFEIMLETEDVIDMSSYGKAREILKKYGIPF